LEATLVTFANVLTLLRILVVPVIIFFVLSSSSGANAAATGVFLIAALTDFFDGRLARWTGKVSELGKAFDPFADRVFIGGTIIALTIVGRVPLVGVILVLVRDVFMIVGYKLLKHWGITLRVTYWGKSYTALFMIAIVLALADWGPWYWLFWVGVAGSLLTGLAYMVKGVSSLKKVEAIKVRKQ
jgi:CDP-diacylglycerol--glycerol-3-phosphate 3-phosphatidyltransferase